MQETFVRAMRSNTDARDLRSARAWLFRIAANLAHDHHRRKALLRHFGSLKRVRAATVEELTQVSGVTPAMAEAIRQVSSTTKSEE